MRVWIVTYHDGDRDVFTNPTAALDACRDDIRCASPPEDEDSLIQQLLKEYLEDAEFFAAADFCYAESFEVRDRY